MKCVVYEYKTWKITFLLSASQTFDDFYSESHLNEKAISLSCKNLTFKIFKQLTTFEAILTEFIKKVSLIIIAHDGSKDSVWLKKCNDCGLTTLSKSKQKQWLSLLTLIWKYPYWEPNVYIFHFFTFVIDTVHLIVK